jgi:hypothetical protein
VWRTEPVPVIASGLVYATLTALLFRSLLPHIATHLPSDLGDPLIITSILSWNAAHLPLTDAWWNFPAFAPLQGVTAFTEHFLLAYPLASPIIWLTGNAVLAYNVVFLLVWPVNALAAYALAHELTGSRPAAFVGGLAFGFAPYLAGHLSHLQLLLVFGMPLGLLGLHRYRRTGAWSDAALFAVGWLATALASAYTLVFFPVLVLLWCIWFVRPGEWRSLAAPAAAAVVASIPLVPLLYGYQVRQAAFGLVRSYGEAKEWAADVTALAGISHREWLWSAWLPTNYGESSIFPGFTIVGLALLAIVAPAGLARSAADLSRCGADLYGPRRGVVSRGLLALAATLMIVALSGVGPFRIYRVFTLGVLLLLAAIFTSARFRASWTQRDPVMLYAVAAVTFWLLALGPEPTWAGERILTYGPYRLFFELHIPAVVRVSARAWMTALPCLAVLAAFGVKALAGRVPRYRAAVVGAAALLVIAESWFVVGAVPVPAAMPAGAIPQQATVLDVPFSDPFVNAAAQYRAVLGGYRTINGYSGYEAPHLARLRKAFTDGDYDAIDQYRGQNDLYVIVRPEAAASFRRWIASTAGGPHSTVGAATVYLLRRRQSATRR